MHAIWIRYLYLVPVADLLGGDMCSVQAGSDNTVIEMRASWLRYLVLVGGDRHPVELF